MLALPSARAQHTLGVEFQVNSSTQLRQRYPEVAIEADGDFIVSWHRAGTGDTPDVFFRRFTSAGVPLAADFQLNAVTQFAQNNTTVDVAADGAFVVAWTSFAQDSSDTDGIFGRRLDATGTALATEFQVNTITERSDYDPALAVASDGDFVVVWSSYEEDQYNVFGQRFDSAGNKLESEFQLNSDDSDFGPAIDMNDGGAFIVVWSSYRDPASDSDVIGRRYDSAGTSIGGEFLVNLTTLQQQTRPDAAIGDDGGFVVVWTSMGQGAGFYDIVARRFSSTGVAIGAEILVNAYTPNRQDDPRVDLEDDGDFVVTWSSVGQDAPLASTITGVFGQRFDSAGAKVAQEFQVNSYTTNHQRLPAIDIDGDGDFVVTWESLGQDDPLNANHEGIFAQRFSGSTGIPLDADGDGLLDPLTDGVLIVRHLFGFTGPDLVGDDVGEDCERCEGPAVTTYLSGLGMVLDIDGDLVLRPLTDGMLALRYLSGFADQALVAGAVGEDCDRCDPGAITSYLEGID